MFIYDPLLKKTVCYIFSDEPIREPYIKDPIGYMELARVVPVKLDANPGSHPDQS